MFADNLKISLRQIRRLLILDLFGLSSLLLPGILADMTGADGIWCLLLGMAGGLVLLGLMQGNMKRMKEGYYSYMKSTAGQLAADVFMVFYLLYFIVLSAYVLYETVTLVLTWMLPEGSYVLISILLLGFAAYGTAKGIEGRARVYEIIFWFLGIPFLVMLCFSVRIVNSDYWTPIIHSSGKSLLDGSLSVWIFLLPLSSLLFIKQFCNKPEKIVSCGTTALVAVTGINVLVYLVVTGVFGHSTLMVLKRPVITLMSMVRLPGGFFTRQDVIMTAVWFFALFALLNTGVFQGTLILKELFNEKKSSYSMWIILVIVGITAVGFFKNSFFEELFKTYQTWIVLPGMAGILLLLWMVSQWKEWRRHKNGGKEVCQEELQQES